MRWSRDRRPPQPDPTEVDTIVARNVALAARFDATTRVRHHELTTSLIRAKRWEAVGEITLTTDVIVTIAGNAVIPVVGLDLALYRHVHSIIVRPTTSVSTGNRTGPARGVVADEPMPIVGLAAPNTGPVSIAWDAAVRESRHPDIGRNVVIHEFAHKIDMSDGYSDGTPPLRGPERARWTEILADEYERADSRPSDAALRPYAWSNPAEFFAVATEAFFCTPTDLRAAKPRLYQALSDFYHQDPAAAPH